MRTSLFSALGLAALLGMTTPGVAMPVAPVLNDGGPLIQVYGGCGPYGHRGPYGGCRPGGQFGGYRWGRSCPPGFRLGPYGRRCWRVY